MWMQEYGAANEPEQAEFLLRYSPYHNIVNGHQYPPTMVVTADHDDHVFPAHAFKMAAALQYANTSDSPIMLRVEKDTGHGFINSVSDMMKEGTEFLSFFAKNLDLKLCQ
jgi:prolyl oligopeptidase